MGRVPGASLVFESCRRKAHYFRENTFISYAKPKGQWTRFENEHLGGSYQKIGQVQEFVCATGVPLGGLAAG